MGNCGSNDAVEVTNSTSNNSKPVSRPPTARIEQTNASTINGENNNTKSVKVLSRPVSPHDESVTVTASNRPKSSQQTSEQQTIKAVSNGNIKNDHNATETGDVRKGSALSQKATIEQNRASSAQQLWINPPTLPAEDNTQKH